MTERTHAGFDEAVQAIVAGNAKAHALWVLLSEPSARDGYALKPMPWEGPGEYQHVSHDDGRTGFVRVPDTGISLQHAVGLTAKKRRA